MFVIVMLVVLGMLVIVMIMRPVIMMFGVIVMMLGIVEVRVVVIFGVGLAGHQSFRRRIDDLALNPLAVAAAARGTMARPAAARAVFRFFLRFAMGALVRLDQRLTVGDGDLVVIGMNFAEGEKAVAVTAVFDERGLQRRFDARDLRQIDVAAQLFALRGFEIKFFDAIAADHDDPGLLRVGGIDKHFVGHFRTLEGGGHAVRRAQIARPDDATVHLIRG